MKSPFALCRSLLIAALLVAAISTAASASTVSVHFYADGKLTAVQRAVPAGMAPLEAALRALVAGPTQEEVALGLTSMIPAGTSINTLSMTNTSVTIDMSSEIVKGLSESRLSQIADQFNMAVWDFKWINAVNLTSAVLHATA
jgi:spore germination protein GerM